MRSSCAFLIFVMLGVSARASELPPEDETLARRGDGVVTQRMFDARAARIPGHRRAGVIRDRGRLRIIINDLLLSNQLAAAARQAGYDQDPVVVERMKLAAVEELAAAWLQHQAEASEADFEAMARERYLLNPERYLSKERIDVSHILVSTEERSLEEAQSRAEQVLAELQAAPERFVELVEQYSDDPSAAANRGSFTGVERGDMVKPFEDSAFALEPGGVAGPVLSQYGYHVIRLDRYHPPEQLSFEEVRNRLVLSQREQLYDRSQGVYLDELAALEVEMTEAELEKMVERQFGPQPGAEENARPQSE